MKENDAINISYETYLDLMNIKDGVFRPLEKFMNYNELNSVIHNNRLENGDIWPLPIIQTIENLKYSKILYGEEYDLNFENITVGTISVDDKYKLDKNKIADLAFRTTDKNHPGVNLLFKNPDFAISGKLQLNGNLLNLNKDPFHLTPKETKEKFKEMRWKTIVGFQTRNVPHLAHEYLQRCGLEMVDGLFLQPISGWKKMEIIELR